MKSVLLCLGIITLHIGCMAQARDNQVKKTELSLLAGLGFSYFHYDVEDLNQPINGETHRFEAPNIRIGVMASRRATERLTLNVSFRLGMRTKRASLYDDVRETGIVPPYTFYHIDESVSQANYFFYEIPVGLEVGRNNLRLGLAGLFRSKMLLGDFDIGALPSIWYVPNDRIKIGIEYYFGTIIGISDIVHDNYNNTIRFNARNRFAQLALQWKLK